MATPNTGKDRDVAESGPTPSASSPKSTLPPKVTPRPKSSAPPKVDFTDRDFIKELAVNAEAHAGFAGEVRRTSEDVARESTRMSNRIAGFEQFLLNLPSQVSSTVYARSVCQSLGNFAVQYDRLGDGWALTYGEPDPFSKDDEDLCWRPLRECTVREKSQGAQLLPILLGQIIEHWRNSQQALRVAHTALDQVDEMIRKYRQEAK